MNHYGPQSRIVFQLLFATVRIPSGDTETIIAWTSKEISDENIKLPTTPGNSLALLHN